MENPLPLITVFPCIKVFRLPDSEKDATALLPGPILKSPSAM